MPSAPDLAGRALDERYEVHERLGEGTFGRVYRGYDRRLGRAVAVKVIKPWWAEDSDWVERFHREARLLARVNDPGVVQIFDIGHAQEGPYYVAELVDGESLAERLKDGPLEAQEARRIAERVCRALAGAHRQGVMHCDVKPANVLLGHDGGVKVGDFGLARLAEASSQEPSATVAGTPRYMSPEQARGRPATAATDVYSVGVVLYEMLAGRPPFQSGSTVELALCHLQDPPPPLPGSVPERLRAVVERALAKSPAARFADGEEMAAVLRAAGAPGAPVPAGAARRARAPRSPNGAPRAALLTEGELEDHAAATAVVALHGRGDGTGSAAIDSAATVRRGQDGAPGAGHRGAAADGPGGATLDGPDGATLDGTDGAMVDGWKGAAIEVQAATVARTRPQAGRAPAGAPPAPPRAPSRARAGGHRRRRLIVALGLLFALAGAIGGLLLAGQRAHTTVPHLRGLPLGGVVARSRRLHVHPVYSRRYSEATRGIAIAQSPEPGTRVVRGASVHVVLSAGPPPVTVPSVVGQSAAAAESAIANADLRYALTAIAAPRSEPGAVVRQSPGPAASAPRGSTVTLSIAETPHWRALTTFSGVDDGHSVAFRILGRRWRVSYSMAFRGTCVLLVVCGGPHADVMNLETGNSFGGFDLEEGESETHVVDSGPGLYRLQVSGGRDSARWSMAVEDFY